MDLVNGLDGVEVVDTRVKTNLVHDNNASLLGSGVELAHRRANVASGDDVGLALDSGLDDIGVVGVGDERDDEVVLSDSLLKSGGVRDIEGNRGRVAKIANEILCGLQGTAGCRASDELRQSADTLGRRTDCEMVRRIADDVLGSWAGDKSTAK